jgi:intein/homing endonuclease
MLADTGNRLGEEVARIKDTYRFYMHRNLNFYPAGPNKRLLRGDCVRGSTMINTNGGFYHINELISNKGFTEVTNMKVDTPNGAKKVTHLYKTKRKTIKIITRNGYSVSGTEEHPMLVLTKDLDYKWVKISELKVGDWVVSKTKYAKPLFGTRKVKLDEATVLGYHVANGCSNRCEISTSDPNVSERLCAAVKRLGGYVHIGGELDPSNAPNHYLGWKGKEVKTNFFKEVLSPLGYNPTSSYDKEIPLAIRMSSKEVIHEFLESYFECDSHVNGGETVNQARKKGKDQKGIEVELQSASKKLIYQLQVMLLQIYGIVSRRDYTKGCISSKTRRGDYSKNTYWRLTITGYDASLFCSTFKRAKANRFTHRLSYTPKGIGSDRRQVPYLRGYVYNIYENARPQSANGSTGRSKNLVTANGDLIMNNIRPSYHSRSLNNWNRKDFLNFTKVHCTEHHAYHEDNSYLDRIDELDPIMSKKVRQLVYLEAHYEQVTSIILQDKEVPVYDITVPDGHAFYANGLVSHNTRIYSVIEEFGWFHMGDESEDDERERASG